MSEQEIVPIDRHPVLEELGVPSIIPKKGTPLSKCPMSLDLSTKRGRALLIAAGNPSDIEFDKNGVCVISAVDWLIIPDEGVNPETGEVSEFARTILFTAEGDTFRTTAAHAPSRLLAALEVIPPPEWKQGVRFLIRKREGKRGFFYHDIRLHPDYLEEE